MTDPVRAHYQTLLAHRYEWMLGGAERQLEQNEALAETLSLAPRAGGRALDLGGGPGFFAVALARRGFEVELVDTSAFLLERARHHARGLPVHTHAQDLLAFLSSSSEPFELCACLGDTLTHLPDLDTLRRSCEVIRERLEPGGRLNLSYRDLSSPREGRDRFLLVRADEERIFTCFLERGEGHVMVHDLVHEREGDAWDLHKSAYPKLIVERAWLTSLLHELGFELAVEVTGSGMIRIVADAGA